MNRRTFCMAVAGVVATVMAPLGWCKAAMIGRQKLLPCRFEADFATENDPDAGIAYISCGDYMWWHIGCWRDAILKEYGYDSCGPLKRDESGKLYFDHQEKVDWDQIQKILGVRHSSLSSSSSSSTAE